MNYYIKTANGWTHLYYKLNVGICSACEKNMYFSQIIMENVKNTFCALERNGIIHIIGENLKDELVYTNIKNNNLYTYKLCTLHKDMKLKNMKLGISSIGLNLLYSIEYNNKILLVNCVLGNNAQPEVIDCLKNDNFFVYKKKVYYSNNENVLGYRDFSDGKPDKFNIISENAESIYIMDNNVIYVKNNKIYLNDVEKVEDIDIKNPIITQCNNAFFLFWKSGEVLKYMNMNQTNEKPKKIISSGEQILYSIQDNENIYYEYADKCEGKPYFKYTIDGII